MHLMKVVNEYDYTQDFGVAFHDDLLSSLVFFILFSSDDFVCVKDVEVYYLIFI